VNVSLSALLVVAAIACAAPLTLRLVPALTLPSAVLELAAGIAVGPGGFGWVHEDDPVRILALLGLAFLLFLAGLEIEFARLRGRPARLAFAGFAVSLCVALCAGGALKAAGLVDSALLVGVALTATSLGIVVPALKDAGEARSAFGQLVIAGASVADFGAVILLSLLFSRDSSSVGARIVLLGSFALVAAVLAVSLMRAGRSMPVSAALVGLQDTTAQIRVRAAFVLLAGFALLADRLGLETILGAFTAGALISLVDKDQAMTHPRFRLKLEAAGYGIFVPVFFVASGLTFDLHALVKPKTIVLVPLFAAALLAARGIPALLYRPLVGGRLALVAGLLQATSLPFLVAAAQIGMELDLLSPGTGAALIAAGLMSVLLFPLTALRLLRVGSENRVTASAAVRPSAYG
jgi:Kef-type K+ transport system membrane component KefB